MFFLVFFHLLIDFTRAGSFHLGIRESDADREPSTLGSAVIDKLPETDSAACVKAVKDCLNDSRVKNDIAYITSNFSFIPASIEQLEREKQSLCSQIAIVKEAQVNIHSALGETGKKVKNKWDNVLNKNVGFSLLEKVSRVISGESVNVPNLILKVDNPDRHFPVSRNRQDNYLSATNPSFSPVNNTANTAHAFCQDTPPLFLQSCADTLPTFPSTPTPSTETFTYSYNSKSSVHAPLQGTPNPRPVSSLCYQVPERCRGLKVNTSRRLTSVSLVGMNTGLGSHLTPNF
ncbi:hypothetical protein ANN_12501 [Periplaneta americana]|uniref:Uncharacterized protein n=1 Tax=Periplaneta americana TaxID=6978 RepID=A0ABQ8TIQ1_PERAM|nr:hypothetical protein ANN_12501 [Periplaneta americana]